jgi:hypothetical protein
VPFRVLIDGEPPGDAHGLDVDEQAAETSPNNGSISCFASREPSRTAPSRSPPSHPASMNTCSHSARSFPCRRIPTALQAAMDDAWRLVPFEHLEQLCPPVRFERSPRVVGNTSRVARPSCTADLNHHLGAPGTIGDLPEPTARVHTVRVYLPRLALISQPTTQHYEIPGTCLSRPPGAKS